MVKFQNLLKPNMVTILLKQILHGKIPSFESEKVRLTAEVAENQTANLFSDTVNS